MKDPVREQVIELLRGGHAHVSFDDAVKDFPEKIRGIKPEGAPYTAWELLEHLRLALWDILEFTRDPKHVSPDWPSGYWPEAPAPPSSAAWEKSVNAIRRDMKEFERIVEDPDTDLYTGFPHGTGQNILREALLVADHNSYHLGQLVLLRRLAGEWKG
jgi:DinB superfamily